MDNTTRTLMSKERKAEIREESAQIISWLEKLVDFQTVAKEANEDTALYDNAITANTVRLAVLSNELQADLDYRQELKRNSESQ
jgi:hypothetical protein